MFITKFTRISISSIIVIAVVLPLFMQVSIVFAQEGEPLPDPPPGEVVNEVTEDGAAEAPAEEGSQADEQPVDAGSSEDTTSDEDQIMEEPPADEDPVSEEHQSTSETPEEVVHAEEEEGQAGEEENPVAEAVQALDEADAVLLDSEGQPIDMASQEAAEMLAAPDPYFCPTGGGACTPAQATITDAINDWVGLGRPSGTFFIEGGFGFAGVTFTQTVPGVDLVFQGGDGGGTTNINTPFSVDTSVFNSLTFNDLTFDAGINVLNSTGALSFNNVIANNPGGDGIEVTNHDGAVSLDNVTASNTGGDGADIQHALLASTNTVTVTNSTFNGNADEGLQIASTGAIIINNVNANNNAGASGGAVLGNFSTSSDPSISVSNSSFNDNTVGNGLSILADGAVTLANVTASGNGNAGAWLDNTIGTGPNSINVFNSQFNDNGTNGTFSGLVINSTGQITLKGVTADNNTDDGAELISGSGTGPENITIKCSALTNNANNGFTANANFGDLGLYSVSTGGNSNAFTYANVTNTIFSAINCDPGNGVKHPRDSKHVECNTDGLTLLELELYAHAITFPAMDISGCNGFARSLFNNASLPGELPEESEFLRGLSIHLEGCEIPEEAAMTIGFEIPPSELENEFAVLFWDKETGTWIEIPGQLTEDGRYTINWPVTGVFVLVTR